jgi:hypothetical protein
MVGLLMSGGPCLAEAQQDLTAKTEGVSHMISIVILAGSETYPVKLDDTPAARAFADMLPLDLGLDDYHGIEKVADLPEKLPIAAAPDSYTPKKGDVT